MKKNLFIITPLIATLALASCFKNDVDPVTNKNSVLKIEGVVLQNFTPTNTTSIKGVAKFEFYVANSPDNTITDTVRFADTFYVTNPNGYTQNYDFDTPEKAKVFNFNINFFVEGGGSASGITATQLLYKRNGTTYLSDPLSFTTTDFTKFITPTKTVTF
jgi:hypothetical protein